uniref:Transmembrane protein 144 n=1 Tax=Salarias fasciatus TaxID=181472 RepID=A0A672I1E1_SALFA
QAAANSSDNSSLARSACGFAVNMVAVVLYGSSVVPAKKIDAGDGMFFQWVTCAAIWLVALVGNLLLNSPTFYPFAMLGGVTWATANSAVIPTVKAIGLGLSLLISGSFSLMMGWASSAGLGSKRRLLNHVFVFNVSSGLTFFFVNTSLECHCSGESDPLLLSRVSSSFRVRSPPANLLCLTPLSVEEGYLLAVAEGLLFGSTLIPILYIKNHSTHTDSVFYGASLFELNYLYAVCCGIFATSSVHFFIYCAVMKNRARIYANSVLPAVLSGFLWAVASHCFFLANSYLGPIITFPITTAGYGLVAGLWACLVFKEITVRMKRLICGSAEEEGGLYSADWGFLPSEPCGHPALHPGHVPGADRHRDDHAVQAGVHLAAAAFPLNYWF